MKRAAWVGLALWLAVAAAASAIAWLAIDQVGQQVTGDPAVTAPTPAGPAAGESGPRSPSGTSTAAASTTRSWSGPAGSVRVSCRSARAAVLGATPADGWRVERAESGLEADVRFERGDEEVRVRASCGASGPVFSAETKD